MQKFGPPFYKQETADSCLPACLRMVLAERGRMMTEAQLRKRCRCKPLIGTLSSDAVAAAIQLGFTDSEESQSLRLRDLRDVLREGIYPIVGVNLRHLRGFWAPHALVVVAVTSSLVRVHDPMDKRLPLSHSLFEAAWEDADFVTILVK